MQRSVQQLLGPTIASQAATKFALALMINFILSSFASPGYFL
jgi:hypothetical protein